MSEILYSESFVVGTAWSPTMRNFYLDSYGFGQISEKMDVTEVREYCEVSEEEKKQKMLDAHRIVGFEVIFEDYETIPVQEVSAEDFSWGDEQHLIRRWSRTDGMSTSIIRRAISQASLS